ncbi:acyl-[acyl-carrier-protein] thioesterase [Cellulosilyticum sp. I15G10I2]|uniref:acyl-[acyl-carrier-protein] thioesterase n=1 Tax=Cellulosilyticum sp. I15G10I2 TaxID=1892843 RepID=UPI00085C4E77|nr:acyl-ACP thioesterase domain-containing protein [Cellulosilyticum sp. I15G10I2]
MSLRLREVHKIEFEDIDFTEKLAMHGIVHYMQQVAANHAIKLGFSYYKNTEKPKYYWVISRVKFEMYKYPSWQDQMAIETYPGGYDKLFAVRLFDLFDQEGEKIGHIIGNYILMDAETERPVRIKGIQGAMNVLDFPYEGEKLDKLVLPTKIIKQDIRKARYTEIDVNKHMNNAYYVKWVVDMIDLEDFYHKEIESLQLNYNTSVTYDTKVKVVMGTNAEDERIVYGTSLDDTVNYFSAKLVMRDIR